MNPEILLIEIELEALKTERAAMEAFNSGQDYGRGYSEGAFLALAEKIRALSAKVKP